MATLKKANLALKADARVAERQKSVLCPGVRFNLVVGDADEDQAVRQNTQHRLFPEDLTLFGWSMVVNNPKLRYGEFLRLWLPAYSVLGLFNALAR